MNSISPPSSPTPSLRSSNSLTRQTPGSAPAAGRESSPLMEYEIASLSPSSTRTPYYGTIARHDSDNDYELETRTTTKQRRRRKDTDETKERRRSKDKQSVHCSSIVTCLYCTLWVGIFAALISYLAYQEYKNPGFLADLADDISDEIAKFLNSARGCLDLSNFKPDTDYCAVDYDPQIDEFVINSTDCINTSDCVRIDNLTFNQTYVSVKEVNGTLVQDFSGGMFHSPDDLKKA